MRRTAELPSRLLPKDPTFEATQPAERGSHDADKTCRRLVSTSASAETPHAQSWGRWGRGNRLNRLALQPGEGLSPVLAGTDGRNAPQRISRRRRKHLESGAEGPICGFRAFQKDIFLARCRGCRWMFEGGRGQICEALSPLSTENFGWIGRDGPTQRVLGLRSATGLGEGGRPRSAPPSPYGGICW